LLAALVLGPAAPGAIRAIDDRWIATRPSPAEHQAADWIIRHTGVYDVFLCDPQTGYRVVGALTGRKLADPLPGYANIAAPIPQLHERAARMLATDDPAEFLSLAARARIRYIFADGTLLDHLPRWRAWDLCDDAFISADGSIVILGIRSDPDE
jgi:hypothetical protein